MALSNYYSQIQQQLQQGTTPPPQINPQSGAEQVQSSLQAMMDPNSALMRNAELRGRELAATRGGVNSSIAAGNAQRAALEAATPLAQQAVAIDQQKQQALTQDWLDKQGFNRQLQSTLALMPVQNSFNMMQAIQQYALEDPALYTPDVVSGYSNFFNQNMNDIMNTYFGGQ